MSTQTTIASAAVHVVGQYNDAGKTLLNAYRSGMHRILGGGASRYREFLDNRECPMVNEATRSKWIGAQEKVNDFLAKRIDSGTSRIVSAMDRVATGATNRIESISERVAGVESPVANSVVDALSAMHRPIATVSVQIADKIAAGAKQIEVRVSGTEEAKPVRTVKAKAAAVKKPVSRAVDKAA